MYVDNLEVVKSVRNGRQRCCHSKRDAAHLSREAWERLGQMPQQMGVQKVKAQLTYKSVLDGRIPWDRRLGNGAADMWTKPACPYDKSFACAIGSSLALGVRPKH